jgi:hypothetical protein
MADEHITPAPHDRPNNGRAIANVQLDSGESFVSIAYRNQIRNVEYGNAARSDSISDSWGNE